VARRLRTTAYVLAACAAYACTPGAAVAAPAPADWGAALQPARADSRAVAVRRPGLVARRAPSPPARRLTAAELSRSRYKASAAPLVVRANCVRSCDAGRLARPGSLLRVRGEALKRVTEVVFLGAEGAGDDVTALTDVRRAKSVDVRVPLGAAAGSLSVVDTDGVESAPSALPLGLGAASPDGEPVELAVTEPHAVFGAARPAGLTYVVHGDAPKDVGIDLVRVSDGVTVAHWDAWQVPPEVPQHLAWDGRVAGKLQATGRYGFRTIAAGAGPPPQVPENGAAVAPALRAAAEPDAAFDFARDRFPIVGPHEFGTGSAMFGGGRHHQGQDTFAACGTPLVAAHGGKVKFAGYHAAAGYYLVIDNAGVGTDYVYMHMRSAASVKEGDKVRAGQQIGAVGDSGDADGCHLHFEIWTAPGWYSGGHPIDPLPSLKAWDQAG
jgi:murein DD-endopeptidase MepM/ murein hydrolase activator NlpD